MNRLLIQIDLVISMGYILVSSSVPGNRSLSYIILDNYGFDGEYINLFTIRFNIPQSRKHSVYGYP